MLRNWWDDDTTSWHTLLIGQSAPRSDILHACACSDMKPWHCAAILHARAVRRPMLNPEIPRFQGWLSGSG
eukprot:348243-Rhodomonas_salina.2